MVSVKIGSVIAAAFIAGAFVASPELRAYAANTIGSTDIINESILSEDIKNSQVKAADIAADAVGGSELQGVTKLLFGQCTLTSTEASTSIASGGAFPILCSMDGIDPDDSAIATMRTGSDCFHVSEATPTNKGHVEVRLRNECASPMTIGPGTIGLLVYDK
jgi:hypothetical protein